LQSACYELRDKLYACKGNHDDNSIASSTLGLDVVVYPDEEYLYLGKQYEKSGVILDAGNHERFYGYYDIPSQKIRLIFINTVDIPYISKDGDLTYKGQGTVSISEEQNLFIQNALKFEEPGWGVMFFSHHGIVKSDVVSAYVGQLWGVIQAYKTNTTFTQTFNTIWGSYTVDVDYTDNPSNEVIACVCGHNHADRSQVVDGALVVSTGCACPSQPSEIDGESVSPTYETATETLLDILTIDRKKGKLYATRYGLGRSREFNYNTISGEIGEITE
jgi:predicted phosphodiesterase